EAGQRADLLGLLSRNPCRMPPGEGTVVPPGIGGALAGPVERAFEQAWPPGRGQPRMEEFMSTKRLGRSGSMWLALLVALAGWASLATSASANTATSPHP